MATFTGISPCPRASARRYCDSVPPVCDITVTPVCDITVTHRWNAATVVRLIVCLTSLTQRTMLALQSCDQRVGGKGGIKKGVRSMEEGEWEGGDTAVTPPFCQGSIFFFFYLLPLKSECRLEAPSQIYSHWITDLYGASHPLQSPRPSPHLSPHLSIIRPRERCLEEH